MKKRNHDPKQLSLRPRQSLETVTGGLIVKDPPKEGTPLPA